MMSCPFPGKRPRTPETDYASSAGIRACTVCRIAFPWTLHSGVLMRLQALTVAGAAQVALGATALAVPVSRLTRASEDAEGTE
jgi:hypothetical protein